jgi:uncharacterized protein YgbK (DUF1537 family)
MTQPRSIPSWQQRSASSPERQVNDLLYAWLGDDFTGSTDVLECLAEGGVPAVLFLRPPTPELLVQFPDARAIGLASDSRSRSPEWMDAELPALYVGLAALGPKVVHYKTCSTFDSAPHRGSIGRAVELGLAAIGGPVPILVGAPDLRRYLIFGNLFAAAGDAVYRIDRHPTMSRHPATPMHEADLRRHLAAQTDLPISLVDLPTLQSGGAAAKFAAADPKSAVMFDGVDAASLAAAGRVLWAAADQRRVFGAGSSGLTNALLAEWRDLGLASGIAPGARAGDVEQLLVVSGSCSPVTSDQIGVALEAGYAGVELAPDALMSDPAEIDRVVEAAVAALATGRSCVLYTARGPLSGGEAAGDALGKALGRMVKAILARHPLPRILFAGGDTSSHAVAELGVDALTWAARLQRGAPLCRVHAAGSLLDGLELVLKGGQIGSPDFFERVRRGVS